MLKQSLTIPTLLLLSIAAFAEANADVTQMNGFYFSTAGNFSIKETSKAWTGDCEFQLRFKPWNDGKGVTLHFFSSRDGNLKEVSVNKPTDAQSHGDVESWAFSDATTYSGHSSNVTYDFSANATIQALTEFSYQLNYEDDISPTLSFHSAAKCSDIQKVAYPPSLRRIGAPELVGYNKELRLWEPASTFDLSQETWTLKTHVQMKAYFKNQLAAQRSWNDLPMETYHSLDISGLSGVKKGRTYKIELEVTREFSGIHAPSSFSFKVPAFEAIYD